jgi:hypothetical protein
MKILACVLGLTLTGDSQILSWNVSANGPANTTWDIFGHFDYTSSAGSNVNTNISKVRIAEYPWWNTSFNCRRMVNITQNTNNSGDGIVEITNFEIDDLHCRVINCSKEILVTEILQNNSQEEKRYLSVLNYPGFGSDISYCNNPKIQFNTTLGINQSKLIFVYYSSPLSEKNYIDLDVNQQNISIQDNTQNYTPENIWKYYYDNSLDFEFVNTTDPISLYDLNDTKLTNEILKSMNHKNQVSANRVKENLLDNIVLNKIYWFEGHGAADNFSGFNQIYFKFSPFLGTNNKLFSSNISNLSTNLSSKFIMILACNSGDNSTTLSECPLQNWMSKAFVEKGADCYLGFLGEDIISTCADCNCKPGDLYPEETTIFNNCFWGNISSGNTILKSKINCDNNIVNAVLVEKTLNSYNVTLMK